MTDQIDSEKILNDIAASNNAKAKPASKKKNNGQSIGGQLRTLVVFLFPVLVLAGGGVFLNSSLQTEFAAAEIRLEQQLVSEIAGLEQRLQAAEQALAQPAQPVAVDDSAVRSLRAEVETDLATLQQALTQLERAQRQQQVPESQPDWTLDEAYYLVRLANQKLQLQADLDGAILLLRTADRLLTDSASNSVFAARQSLANDLTALDAVSELDREGIYLQLEGLSNQVESIDLLSSMRENFSNLRDQSSVPATFGANNAANPGWLQSSLDFLGSVFVWRQWEENPSAVLVPGQESTIKQSLRLFLAQAQVALLLADEGLYQSALSSCQTWLQRYSSPDSQSSFQQSLQRLKAIDIAPPLPSLEQTLALLSAAVANAQ